MVPTDLPPPMTRFSDDVRKIVREGGGEAVVTANVADRLRALLREHNILDSRYTRPKADDYVLYPVWVEPDGSFASPQPYGMSVKSPRYMIMVPGE